MFAFNKANQPDIKLQNNEKIIDPLTIWLIRISCLLIIIFFQQSFIRSTFSNIYC